MCEQLTEITILFLKVQKKNKFLFCHQALPSSSTSGAKHQRNCQDQGNHNPKGHDCYDSHLRSAPRPWAVARARRVQTWEVAARIRIYKYNLYFSVTWTNSNCFIMTLLLLPVGNKNFGNNLWCSRTLWWMDVERCACIPKIKMFLFLV